MNLDLKTKEIKKSLHGNNSVVMAPVSLGFAAGILLYLTFVFQGLASPEGGYHWQFIMKFALAFLVVGGPNIFIFESWVSKELTKASRVLAWDGDESKMSDREAVESLTALLDFPHRFIIRFIVQWIIGGSLLVGFFMLLYQVPWMVGGLFMVGVVLLLCLMSTFHYFVIKSTYTAKLEEGLAKVPNYFERREFARRRVTYRRKILIYILVLVGAMTWVTTHLSLAGHARSINMQRDQFLSERIKKEGEYLESSLERGDSRGILKTAVSFILGGNVEHAYLLNGEGENLLGDDLPPLDRELIERTRMSPEPAPSALSARHWREVASAVFSARYWSDDFLAFRKPLVVEVTDRTMHAYAGGRQYTVTADHIGEKWRLVTIQPQPGNLSQALLLLAMVTIVVVLSFFFARYMQREIMAPLTRIIQSSKDVAAGDLSDPPPIMADDEMGEMAVNHLKMVASIRAMVEQIGQAANSVDGAANEIVKRVEDVSEGSQAQSVAVEETTAAITEMNQTIGNIAESVDALASSAE